MRHVQHSFCSCYATSPPSGEGSSYHQLPWAAEPPPLTCTMAPCLPRLGGLCPLLGSALPTGVFLLLMSRLSGLVPSSPVSPFVWSITPN